jgi:hypothetical protein
MPFFPITTPTLSRGILRYSVSGMISPQFK